MTSIHVQRNSEVGLRPALALAQGLDALAKLNQESMWGAGHAPIVALPSRTCVWYARHYKNGKLERLFSTLSAHTSTATPASSEEHMHRILIAVVLLFPVTAVSQQSVQWDDQCTVWFSIVWTDLKFHTTVPGKPEDMKWLPENSPRKYPGICYDAGAQLLRATIFFDGIGESHRTVVTQSPVEGTITNPDYSRSSVTGTVSTSQSVTVPYEYAVLSLEKKNTRGEWVQIASFGRQSPCRESYGSCIAVRDLIHPLVKDMMVWLRRTANKNPNLLLP